jgi:hypothetical protein
MTRPMGLTVSALFMVLSIVLGIVLSPTSPVPANVTTSNNVDILFGWVFIALQFLVTYFYWNARNWARIVILICSGWLLLGFVTLSLLPVPPWIHQAIWGRPLFFVRTVGDSLLAIYLLWYLNTPAIRAWFKRPILGQEEAVSN